MIVQLKYMGVVHDGMPDVLELEEGATVKTLKNALKDASSIDIKPIIANASFIVNNVYADEDTILEDNSHVIVLTPLGGG
jgi:molybdopterin converting factor small subunit